jgi:Dolichyl-phosphate-mannose-protein mannosyltransferase
MPGQMTEVRRLWPELKQRIIRFSHQLDGFDAGFLIVLVLTCFLYNHDLKFWAGTATIGNWQYGDAEFWWNGGIQFADGIVADNPNLTYRMGYATVAGLWIALFGTRFAAFHTFLLFQLTAVLYLLYLSLRPSLGKLTAAAGILLVVLNPITAEWLAISTSDSVGLLLNLAAIICLITALSGRLSLARLAGCGFFIALASLTRPLMTPFLGAAVVLILCTIHVPWRRRLRGIFALLAAFLIPTALWVGALRSVTGAWNLAGSQASAFYAASDPSIQVWNPAMYAPVTNSAERRFGASPTQNQIDQEFQRLTVLNYRKYVKYHIRRFLPHLRAIAGFSIEDAGHVNSLSRRLRYLILVVVGIGLIVPLLREKQVVLAAVTALVFAAWLYHPLYSAVVLIALFSVLPLTLWNKSGFGGAVFFGYWLVGMLALYLVGGTWGAPDGSSVAWNALGYRLGSQFFFASDLIVLYFVHNIVRFQRAGVSDKAPVSLPHSFSKWRSVTVAAIGIWLALTTLELSGGTLVVLYRGLQRNLRTPQAFPELAGVLPILKTPVPDPRRSERFLALVGNQANYVLTPNVDSPYVLTTAGSTDFMWNLDGQQRTKVNFALQTEVFPFQFQPRFFVDFPMQLKEEEWTRRQGAWLLRRFADEPQVSNFPWYFSDVEVRAFIPVSQNTSEFDVARVQWFQLPKYASQLYHAKQLDVRGAKLEFVGTSGTLRYPRRFALRVDPATGAASPSISIDVSKASGRRNLNFGWQFEAAPGDSPRQLAVELQGFDAGRKVSDEVRGTAADSALPPLQTVSLDLNQPVLDRVLIQFAGPRPGEAIWIYELNVIADEWDW